MDRIKLTKGESAIVDADDFNMLSRWKWHYTNGYARTSISLGYFNKKQKKLHILMHRLIMNCPSNMEVDHINHNPLDNRKQNLRIVSRKQNGANRKLNINNTSGFKGVCWDEKCTNKNKKWVARIHTNGKIINLGRYLTKKDAAIAYNDAAKKYFNEFASLNIL